MRIVVSQGEIHQKSYKIVISYCEKYIFRIAKSDLVLKMVQLTRKMERTWDHWATVEDLSNRFDISKRRVQQIIATNINVIEKAVLVRVKVFGLGLHEIKSIPIYRRLGK